MLKIFLLNGSTIEFFYSSTSYIWSKPSYKCMQYCRRQFRLHRKYFLLEEIFRSFYGKTWSPRYQLIRSIFFFLTCAHINCPFDFSDIKVYGFLCSKVTEKKWKFFRIGVKIDNCGEGGGSSFSTKDGSLCPLVTCHARLLKHGLSMLEHPLFWDLLIPSCSILRIDSLSFRDKLTRLFLLILTF